MKSTFEKLRDSLLSAFIIIFSLEIIRLIFYNFEI